MTKSTFTERYDYFRKLLVDARLSANLTQVELADRLQRPQSFVSKYERAERRIDVVEFLEIADAIGIDPFELLKQLKGHARNGH
ncbi:helix-turn-helix domain-containing protein [Planctomycetes bacterium TBK1r]|uniref:Helix-turn-helix domain protein n=1 Tax=Stieleria magnilauensis TaxID=2527963 RepID=A0ABX5XRE2_9BACT|nr:Helix-turn-helix domain protein [Planctomycetes bacterium TBK1r]